MTPINQKYHLRDLGYSNADNTVQKPRHRWYFYKEGFSPELVKMAIQEEDLGTNDLVIDPFNGSGTVTLASSIIGIPSVGYEVNPFTAFLAATKAASTKIKVLERDFTGLVAACQEQTKSPLEGFSSFTEHNGNEKWLFNKSVLRTFEAGYRFLRDKNSNSANLLRLALIYAAMKNCNAVKDGKCLRYRKTWKEQTKNAETFLQTLGNHYRWIIADQNTLIKSPPSIVNNDCRESISQLDREFDLCVTSPPYLNTFDYTDIYRPELFLGRFVKSQKELYQLRLSTVRSHIQAKWDAPEDSDFGVIYSGIIQKINENPSQLMSKNIPIMIQAYFEDLKTVLAGLRSKASNKASAWFVVSTSAYANIHVPVDLILAEIATSVGWKLREIGVLREIYKRKTKYSPDIDKLRESVVILDVA